MVTATADNRAYLASCLCHSDKIPRFARNFRYAQTLCVMPPKKNRSNEMKPLEVIKNRPIISFFILTFMLSWSGIIIVSFFTGIPAPSKTFESIAPFAILPLVIGPTIVSFLLIGIIYGKNGFKNLFSRLLRWKHNVKWYVFAIVTLPMNIPVQTCH